MRKRFDLKTDVILGYGETWGLTLKEDIEITAAELTEANQPFKNEYMTVILDDDRKEIWRCSTDTYKAAIKALKAVSGENKEENFLFKLCKEEPWDNPLIVSTHGGY
ncbi:hypothetical protein D6783_05255, partial [Candidatus Woesearchaeota archaeon]